jgi:hypothetical protein
MNLSLIAALLIAAAVAIGIWRTTRADVSRRTVRVALQLAAGALIYLALFPPRVDERFAAETLVVLTPGATAEQIAKPPYGIATIALPGVAAASDVERVPDLGTALRRHPKAARLHIVGGGLPMRDLDAARSLPIVFDAAPLPAGIIDLNAPASVRSGSVFSVRGRVEGINGGRVELRDPAGAVVARSPLAEDGAFALEAAVRTEGGAVFDLRLLDRDDAIVERMSQAVFVQPGDALRVLVLAGAPDPELKYLRRWAVDAGVELASHIVLSDGIAMQDGSAALDADALAHTDVVIVDERAWKALDATAHERLRAAVRDGLGLLLRVTGALPDDVAADWRTLGFRVRAADVPQTFTLQTPAGGSDASTTLTRRALLVEADDATPLLRGSDGTPAALWRGDGLGRVAIWWAADMYRIALGGDAGAFGTLWSRALATVARARSRARPEIPANARVSLRSVLCGLDEDAVIEPPRGPKVPLSIDGADAHRCAAYWPAESGWHALVSAKERWPFYVGEGGAGASLAAARDAERTRNLAAAASGADSPIASRRVPAPRWPFFVGWLAIVAMLWWVERSRPETAIG